MRRPSIGTSAVGREKASPASKLASTSSTSAASSSLSVNTVMQSMVRQAGTRPCVLHRPFDGLRPTRWLNAAGTRPDPAVSVPSAKATSPAATATALPDEEPPLT